MKPVPQFIHFAPDEKFINAAHWSFEAVYPNRNTFYILVDDTTKETKHVSLKEGVYLKGNERNVLESLLLNIDKRSVFVFHGMSFYNAFIVNRLPKDCKVIWTLFGFEYYTNPFILNPLSFYGSETRKKFLKKRKEESVLNVVKDTLKRPFFYNFFIGLNGHFKETKKAMERSDFLGILYKEEYLGIASKLGGNSIQHFPFTFYPINRMISDIDQEVHGYDILLGNSASYTNNHLEAIGLLSNLGLGDKKIICPLSYGDYDYAGMVAKEGFKKLDDNFHPLMEFMPLHEYNSYLLRCSVVIMNHYRQQAVGNVLTMLWLGAKVFLDERNSLYAYLKRIGIHVYSINKELQKKEDLQPLTHFKRKHNRKILEGEIGEDAVLSKIKALTTLIA